MSASNSPRPAGARRGNAYAWPLAAAILCVACSIVAYRHSLRADLVSDDYGLLYKVVRGGPLAVWWHGAQDGFVRPMIGLSFWVDWRLWRLNASGYHLDNIVTHGLNGGLVALIAWQIGRMCRLRRPAIPASVAAAYFLFHPAHSEAVSWVSGRTDVIAAFWSLAAIYCALRYVGDGQLTAGFRMACLITMWLAMMSKESAIGAFVVIVLVVGIATWTRRGPRSLLSEIGPFAILGLCYGLLRIALLGHHATGGYSPQFNDWRPSTLASTSMEHIESVFGLVWPWALAALAVTVAVWLAGCKKSLGAMGIRGDTSPGSPLPERTRTAASSHSGAEPVLLAMAGALIAAVIMNGPAMNLIVAPNGEGSRVVYLPSAAVAVSIGLVFWWLELIPAAPLGALPALVIAWLLYSPCLRADLRYREAGAIATQTITLTRTNMRGRTLLLNVPDRIDGAYILRNSLSYALWLRYGIDPKTVLARHEIKPGDLQWFQPDTIITFRHDGFIRDIQYVNRL